MSEKLYTEENSEYLKKNPTWHTEDSPWKAEQILKMLERNAVNPKSIAEIGCGAGEILNQLHSSLPKDTYYTGYDISIDAITLARQREKERLSFNHENLLDKDVFYDLLLIMDVIEHVDDYIGFLRACKTKSENIIIHIPLDISVQSILRNKPIQERNSLGHIHYFMKDTALATLVDSGYEIVDYFYTAGGIELSYDSIKSKLALLPRKLLFSINKDFAVRVLGGYSLLVLIK